MPLISSLGVMSASNLRGASPITYDYIITGMSSSPYLSGIAFNDSEGFGTVLANPATLPSRQITSCVLNKENTAVLCTNNSTTSSVLAYAWSKGFGTKYADPSTAISSCLSANFNSASNLIFVYGPGIYAYDWSNSTGFGAKYTDPATQPAGGAIGGVASGGNFLNNAGYVVTGDFNAPYLWGYGFSGGFNTKFANPSTSTFSYINDIKIFGNDLVAARGGTPYIHAYASSFTGFGTKYANPPTQNVVYRVAASPSLNTIFCTYTASSTLGAIRWTPSVGWGTQYTSISGYGASNKLSVNKKGNAIAMSKSSTPYLQAIRWDYATGFGTFYNNPTATIASSVSSLTFQI